MSVKMPVLGTKRAKVDKKMTETKATENFGFKTFTREGIFCHTSMPEKMQLEAVACAKWAVQKYGTNKRKEIAAYICKEFDEQHGQNWQCVIGKDFNVNVRDNENTYIHMEMGENLEIILFQTD